MPGISNLHRPVSNRGQWRDTYAIVADSVPDPTTTVFGFQVWPIDDRPGACDYGQRFLAGHAGALSASSNDGTGRLSAVVSGNTIFVSWLFPSVEMQRLRAGSYEAGVLAQIAGEMTEIQRIRFVVQDRGAAPAPVLVPPATPTPDLGGGTYAIDVKEF